MHKLYKNMDISSWNVLMLHIDECSRKICVKLHKNMDISSRNVHKLHEHTYVQCYKKVKHAFKAMSLSHFGDGASRFHYFFQILKNVLSAFITFFRF